MEEWDDKLALSLLFGFMSTVLVVLGRFSDLCKEIAGAFPRTLFTAQNNHSRRFKLRRYVVSRKCHRLKIPLKTLDQLSEQKSVLFGAFQIMYNEE